MDTRAFIDHMAESMRSIFAASVIPIWSAQNNRPVQVGTGTLVRVGEHRFLITAEHVTAIASKHGFPLYISDLPQGSPNIELVGRLDRTIQFDVSVWDLNADIVAKLPNRTFLTTASFERTETRPKDGWYIVHGYPHEISEVDTPALKATAKTFTYGTDPFHGETSNLENYNPDAHFLLSYSQAGVDTKSGVVVSGPAKLQGISGCSVWHTYYKGLRSAVWTTDDAKIVGVETCIYPSVGAIRFTKWWVVNQILRKQYPELSYALDIVSPSHRIST